MNRLLEHTDFYHIADLQEELGIPITGEMDELTINTLDQYILQSGFEQSGYIKEKVSEYPDDVDIMPIVRDCAIKKILTSLYEEDMKKIAMFFEDCAKKKGYDDVSIKFMGATPIYEQGGVVMFDKGGIKQTAGKPLGPYTLTKAEIMQVADRVGGRAERKLLRSKSFRESAPDTEFTFNPQTNTFTTSDGQQVGLNVGQGQIRLTGVGSGFNKASKALSSMQGALSKYAGEKQAEEIIEEPKTETEPPTATSTGNEELEKLKQRIAELEGQLGNQNTTGTGTTETPAVNTPKTSGGGGGGTNTTPKPSSTGYSRENDPLLQQMGANAGTEVELTQKEELELMPWRKTLNKLGIEPTPTVEEILDENQNTTSAGTTKTSSINQAPLSTGFSAQDRQRLSELEAKGWWNSTPEERKERKELVLKRGVVSGEPSPYVTGMIGARGPILSSPINRGFTTPKNLLETISSKIKVLSKNLVSPQTSRNLTNVSPRTLSTAGNIFSASKDALKAFNKAMKTDFKSVYTLARDPKMAKAFKKFLRNTKSKKPTPQVKPATKPPSSISKPRYSIKGDKVTPIDKPIKPRYSIKGSTIKPINKSTVRKENLKQGGNLPSLQSVIMKYKYGGTLRPNHKKKSTSVVPRLIR